MDHSNTATPQAEAAALPTAVDPAPAPVAVAAAEAISPVAASEALTNAMITGASAEEIQTLRTALEQAKQAAAAPAEPEPDPAPTPEPVLEDAAPVAELEEPSADDSLEEPTLAGDEPQNGEAPKVSDRQRIAHLSDEDKLASAAINLLTRRGLSLAEATQRVLGDISQKQESQPQAPAAQPPVPGEDLTALLARQTELETVLENAAKGENLFDADINAASNELRKITAKIVKAEMAAELKELRESVKTREQQETSDKQAVFEAARDKSWQETRGKYAELSDAESPLYLMTKAIADMARADAEHPLHVHANKANFVAHCAAKAAARLGTAPVAKAPASNGNGKAAPAPVAAPRPGPASGSRASAPAAPAPSRAAVLAKSEADLNAVLEGHSGAYQVSRPAGFVR